jgi:hypothetical protein
MYVGQMDMTETLVGQTSLPPVDEDNQVDSESFGFEDQTESAGMVAPASKVS